MHSTLIIYSTTDGQTKLICEKIKKSLISSEQTKIVSLKEVHRESLESFDKIVIGASIRYGKHNKNVYKFIEANKNILQTKISAFFTVNVVARKPNKDLPETNPYMQKFIKISNWTPTKLGVFAGKIDYPKYKFFDKQIIRFIMFITKGPTNISKIYEFTNWKKVEEFAQDLDKL
tara:strand:+ start:1219 stop:1743 length:525 start_codon:yes stop_codon:yes gene_type:complete